MKTNLLKKKDTKCMESSEDYSEVLELYDSDENPLVYMFEPKGSVKNTSKDHVTTKEDLENIL